MPFEKVLGQKIGKRFQQLHEEHGVTFYLNHKVVKIHGKDQVSGVEIDSGEQMPADIVLMRLGRMPTADQVQKQIDWVDYLNNP